jgi:hypothetical protein
MPANDQMLAEYFQTPEGRSIIAQSMYEPFKEGRDYVGIARKCIFVDKVPNGAPMWYDKDPQFTAYVGGIMGTSPQEIVKGERVELAPFPIVVLVRVPVLEVAVRRFNVLDRAQVRARAEMAEQEDTQFLGMLDYAATRATAAAGVTAGVYTTVTQAAMSELYSLIERNDAPVANVLMNAQDYRYIRYWTGTQFDPVTRRELIKTGYMGDLWGAEIRISKLVTQSYIYALADPEFLGVLAVRIDLASMDANDAENLMHGWSFYEYIGLAIIADVGVARLALS